ncbi:hypothetical protein ACPV5T_19030 [Vibrio astriarenae]
MLISVANLDLESMKEKPMDNFYKKQVVTNLLLANFSRKHIVVLNRNQLRFIIRENEVFGGNTPVHAQDMLYSITGTGALLNKLSTRIEVNFLDESEYGIIERDNKTIISVSYKVFCDQENLGTPILLGENLNDAKLYLKFSELFLRMNGEINGVKLNIEPDHGGGSTTIEKFNYHTNKNRMCFCILDSDKKFPEDCEKNTSKAFKEHNRTIKFFSKATVIDAQEIESIIPYKILEDMLPRKGYSAEDIKKLDLIHSIGNKRLYLDHKKGISLKEAIYYKNDKGSDFWTNTFKEMGNVKNMDCFKESKCLECDSCTAINGLGENILSNTVSYIEENNINKYKDHIPAEILDTWSQFVYDVIHWGATLSHRASVT